MYTMRQSQDMVGRGVSINNIIVAWANVKAGNNIAQRNKKKTW